MAGDLEKLLNLTHYFPQAEESQTENNEPTPKSIQTEDRQSNNEMIEKLNYMKSDMESSKNEQNAVQDCWF